MSNMIGAFTSHTLLYARNPRNQQKVCQFGVLCPIPQLALAGNHFMVYVVLGCDFFSPETNNNTQLRKRTGGNNFFKMASFAYGFSVGRY
jgi:hypothetical protein